MSFEDRVKIFEGQKFYKTKICELYRELPIRQVDEEIWIASNHKLVLGKDVEFTQKVGKELASRIKPYNPDVLLTAEAKALPLAYEIARELGLRKILVARKEVKSYMKKYLVEEVKSITTSKIQKLVLELDEKIEGKRICLFDDVVSTYGTMNALEKLVKRAGGEIVCKAAVWLEGPWYEGKDLIYLEILPIWVTERKFNKLRECSINYLPPKKYKDCI